MPEFDVWRYNDRLFQQVKIRRKENVDPNTKGKVALSVRKPMQAVQKPTFTEWIIYLQKELLFNKE